MIYVNVPPLMRQQRDHVLFLSPFEFRGCQHGTRPKGEWMECRCKRGATRQPLNSTKKDYYNFGNINIGANLNEILPVVMTSAFETLSEASNPVLILFRTSDSELPHVISVNETEHRLFRNATEFQWFMRSLWTHEPVGWGWGGLPINLLYL